MRNRGSVILVLGLIGLLVALAGGPAPSQEGARNLGPQVNSPDSDFGPIVTADGNALYFTSDREGGLGAQDIWVSRRAGGDWGKPVNLGDRINTKYNEGPDTFSIDEKTMFFTRCDKLDEPGACDIFTASWDDTAKRWGNVKGLGPNVNSKYSDANSSLSYDGQTLYFVSDRPGEPGQRRNWDIFISRKKGAEWGKAERLGPPINTPGNELNVMIQRDGASLYFSSDGHGGLGGPDIFVSHLENGKYGAPQNLGPAINTPENDMYFTIPASGDMAYLASDRPGGSGLEDLYSIPLNLQVTPPLIFIKGLVVNRASCAAGQAPKMIDLKTCAPVKGAVVKVTENASGQVIIETVTDADGVYKAGVLVGKEFTISATAAGYSPSSEKFSTIAVTPYQVIEKNIFLEPSVR